MFKSTKHILWFKNVSLKDTALVGGKTAALGEMFANLKKLGINLPDGFAITASAYNYFLKEAGLKKAIEERLVGLNTKDVRQLKRAGAAVRQLIVAADLPSKLENKILKTYKQLSHVVIASPVAEQVRNGINSAKQSKKIAAPATKVGARDDLLLSLREGRADEAISVAVRSSATAEDLPGASFAGQQETYLNIKGDEQLLLAVKKCFASLFTDRALSYRVDKGFPLFRGVALSVAVQKMVRADLAASGVAFTNDTETGFNKIVVINSSYGLGEAIVQGAVIPDEFLVFKPMLDGEHDPIIGRQLGKKDIKIIYSQNGTKQERIVEHQRLRYSLNDQEVVRLARWCVAIEKHFSKKYGHYQPMDIEWAKDGQSKELFILQARPETVHSIKDPNEYEEYRLKKEAGEPLLVGAAIGEKIAVGRPRVIKDTKDIGKFKKGEVLVTDITDPDWEPIMKIAAAIVTDSGGRTSHAAIVSRELGIPAVVGTKTATRILWPSQGQNITVDCSSGKDGFVYEGALPFKVIKRRLDNAPSVKTQVMVNVGAPREAFRSSFLPVKGVGLGRLEFIINSFIRIHPNALINFEKLRRTKGAAAKKVVGFITQRTTGYQDKRKFYVDKLTEGVAKIAAAFWPNKVIIRFSDFKTNEYRALVGGEFYEPEEENPMLGWRGAARYLDPGFKEPFKLECLAIKRVREKLGFTNVVPMVPFCRTVAEGKQVAELIKKNGLNRERDKTLELYVMCEIPSDVVSAKEFLKVFDGMSIGSNDLTQLVLGIDRDSAIVSHIGNENDPAVRAMIKEVIHVCRQEKKYIGICGQAPSDFPDFTKFLVKEGIDSISLNPDAVLATLPVIAKAERYRSSS